MRELPFKASLRVKLDDESGNAVVLLNGARVSQASILDPKWMDSFDCTFSSNGGGNGKLQMRNIHLLVYGVMLSFYRIGRHRSLCLRRKAVRAARTQPK